MADPFQESQNLRHQTEQARLDFMKTDLAMCLTLADLAETKYGLGNREHAEQTLAKAEKGHSDMLRFFSETKGLTPETESELRSKLNDVRERLDGLQRFRQP